MTTEDRRCAWYTKQAQDFGDTVKVAVYWHLKSKWDDPEDIIEETRLAAHFGRLALGETYLSMPVVPVLATPRPLSASEQADLECHCGYPHTGTAE